MIGLIFLKFLECFKVEWFFWLFDCGWYDVCGEFVVLCDFDVFVIFGVIDDFVEVGFGVGEVDVFYVCSFCD